MTDPGSKAIIKALERLGRIGKARVVGYITSGTLRRALVYRREGLNLYFSVPYYWARYYHDGRGPIFAKPGRKLVYFRDPKNDPRIATGYPKTRADIKPLTRQQFYDGVRMNKQMEKLNPDGGPQQYMLIRDDVGPAMGEPFFKLGFAGFESIIKREIQAEMKASISLVTTRSKRSLAVKVRIF